MPIRILSSSIMAIVWSLIGSMTVKADNHANDLPLSAIVLPGYTLSSVRGAMSTRPLHPIEGIWQMTADGALIAIERADDGQRRRTDGFVQYRIVLIQSPNRAAMPGSVIGYVQPTARRNIYNARIYTAFRAGRIMEPHGFMMMLQNNGEGYSDPTGLVLARDDARFSVDLWRMLPYLYRKVVRRNPKREAVDGCVRIYPEPSVPRFPRYL